MRRASILAFVALCFVAAEPATNPPTVKPKLLVLVVFDQMRGDYIGRWYDHFTTDGFHRLANEGAWFTNCNYPYASTMTGCGHASLLTGCSPERHGIIANEWYDREIGKEVYCATTDRSELVFTVPPPEKKKTRPAGSPERMLAPTVGDVLKESSPTSKVVALSLKDRSACLPGGKRPDASYWFDLNTGTFVTSTYYRDRCHDWVAKFNATKLADTWLGKTWDRLRPDLDYDKLAGPDDVDSESPGISRKQGRVFPHPFAAKVGKEYYEDILCSPAGSKLLLNFAVKAFDAMELGKGDAVDLLSISFSSNDLIGHAFGPDSQEVLDITLQSDLIVARLLQFLDSRVGKGNYLLALTADHGVCPIPEVARKKGLPAVRLHPDALKKQIEDFLNEKYGDHGDAKNLWIEDVAFPWLYLNYRKFEARGLKAPDVASALAGWLKKQPDTANAYTRADLAGTAPEGDPFFKPMVKAYYPPRSGDVAIVLKPYHLSLKYATGTTHGSPHPYDTHVPLLFMGPGIPVGKFDEAVTPQSIAAVFAQAAGIKPPAKIDADVPQRLRATQPAGAR